MPAVTEALAADVAAAWLGQPAYATPLYGEFDHNFRIATPEGRAFVLKIMRDASPQTRRLIELQIAMLQHLAGKRIAIQCPRAMATASGESTRVVRASGGAHVAWMLDYIEGQILDSYSVYSDALLFQIGYAVAEVDRALEDFFDPRADRALMWDVARAGELAGLIETIADEDRRALVQSVFAHFQSHLAPRLASRPRSVIHNDGGNQHNMIVVENAAGQPHIAGIIDFGDAVLTHTVCGLGIAAAYATFGRDDPVDAVARVAAGYHAANPLRDDDIELVAGLAATRLAMSVAVAAERVARDPNDAYAVVSTEPAWRALTRLARSDLAATKQAGQAIRRYIDGAK